MRVVLIGSVDLSCAVCERLLTNETVNLVGVVTRSAPGINADHCSLQPLAERAGSPCVLADEVGQEAVEAFVERLAPDVLFCIGWSHMLPDSLLGMAPRGAVGYHPAALPRNRGRHPLIWALALGLEETASTFFFMTDEADAGPIIDQRRIKISDEDDAATLYQKMTDIALTQLDDVCGALASGSVKAFPQDPTEANVWRRRGIEDGRIDWRMSMRMIANLVRSLRPPYPGAHCQIGGKAVKVWRVMAEPAADSNLEPGKVLARRAERDFLVKCADGALWVVEHDAESAPTAGDYL